MAGREGEQVGNYRLIKSLGPLGYLGEDIFNGNRVTIKFLFGGFKEQYNKEFLREAVLLTYFKHPNILQVFSAGMHGNAGYLVMQYASNGAFRERYPAGTILPIATIVPFVKQLASVLQYIEDDPSLSKSRWLAHTVVRSKNMLLGDNNEILLGGFDEALRNSLFDAWNEERRLTIDYVLHTTPGTWSMNAHLQYTLANTVYDWLCGSLPFAMDAQDYTTVFQQVHSQPPPSLRSKNPAISQAIEDVITKALSKKPEDRYESVSAFAEAFERAAPGGTLLDRHPRGTTLAVETILSYVKQIASALQYAHERGIYGDIRPKKMFVGPNNTILLSGFDLALHQKADADKVTKDYFEYRAPEQTEATCTPACNQYSLGIMVYEWLAGNVPFQGEAAQIAFQHKHVTPPSLREKRPAISHEVEEVVMKALAKDPERRYESIQDFVDALEEAIVPAETSKFTQHDRSGQQFGKYRLVRRLGYGGFAEVYLAEHIQLHNFFAIKILFTHLSSKELADLKKEATTIASFQHPSIVRAFDIDIERTTYYLVMDYAPKGSMRQFHARGSRLSLLTVVKYIKQIADALQHAHDRKIIHRDVKPENMLIGADDTLMLSDFGLSVIAHSSASWSEQVIAGTARYMAPEQVKGKAVRASDQYSLAITAYEWLCGAPPFDEGNNILLTIQQLQEAVPPMSERGAVVSQEVEQVILKALDKEPTKRFASIKAFAEALEKAAQLDRNT